MSQNSQQTYKDTPNPNFSNKQHESQRLEEHFSQLGHPISETVRRLSERIDQQRHNFEKQLILK